ncbi:hypothetical protein C0J52_06303 [Blattella germanica]|nr:hypothetical protein C0J52_06303 [Blattella germanica]
MSHSSIVQGLTFSCNLVLLSSVYRVTQLVYLIGLGDCFIEAVTPAYISSRVFFLPLRGLSITLPKAKARLSQSRSVAFRGGALLNLSWNAPIICAINSNN